MSYNKMFLGIVMSIISAFILLGCQTSKFTNDPLETVESLDLEKYLGRWYEIARFDSSFERDIYGATAEYSLRADGKIDVLNSGFKGSLEGPYTSVNAIAWRPENTEPGKLKVKFFKLFSADYMVFGLDQENYQWALVGNDTRNFLWFLSRTPKLSNDTIEMMKELAIEQGYDLAQLNFIPQKSR